MGEPRGFGQAAAGSGRISEVALSPSPARSDVERRNSAKYAGPAALRRIQNKNPIVGYQLSGAAVEEEQKHNLAIRLISGTSSVANPEFTPFNPAEKGTGFSSCQDGRLNRHDWTLCQNGSLLGIRCVEKFFESLPAYRDFRVIGGCRHQRIVGRAGTNRRLKEPKEKGADEEEAKSKRFHFLVQKTDYTPSNPRSAIENTPQSHIGPARRHKAGQYGGRRGKFSYLETLPLPN
jgi:hypothetical protein